MPSMLFRIHNWHSVALALCLTASLSSCSSTSPSGVALSLNGLDSRAVHGAALPNMDEVESDSGIFVFSSEEERARETSALWISHAERLASSSKTASLAAYLRAAHTSLTALAGESCTDPFNESCAELRSSYEVALTATILAYSEASWRDIDLAPTRYRSALATQPEMGPLDALSISLATQERADSGRRSGIGAEAVACRAAADPITSTAPLESCTPLTFVLSFDAPLSSERIGATLTAYDAAQQSVVDIAGRELSLAADFGSALDLLTSRATLTKQQRLFCLGSPSPSQVTMLALLPDDNLSTARQLSLPLLLDPALSENLNICIFSLRPGESSDRSARLLARLARVVADQAAVRPLLPRPADLFLVAQGEQAISAASAFLGRLTRAARARPRARAQGTLRVLGVYSLSEHVEHSQTAVELAAQLETRAATLRVPAAGPFLDGRERPLIAQYQEIKSTLAALNELPEATATAAPGEAESPYEPLQLSPLF